MKKAVLKHLYIYSILFLAFGCQVSKPPAAEELLTEDLSEEPQSEAQLDSLEVDSLAVAPDEEVPVIKQTVYRASSTRIHDLLHTKLEVSFDLEKQYLYGTATLELKPYFYPQSELVLDAKGFDIHAVSLVDSSGKHDLDYTYDGLQLTIDLGREYTRDEHYIVEIKYTAKPNEIDRPGSEAITGAKGLYFIDPLDTVPGKPTQIWTQGETEASSCWFPTIDSPNERTTQEIYITVDKSFKTLSNGELIYSQLNEDNTRTDYWKMDHSHAPYLFMMAIGKFAIVEDSWKDVAVNYYVEPEYEQYAMDIFGHTPEMLSFFSEKLDYEYPWSKYAQVVVRDYVSGAMENTSASLYMEALQMTERELLDKNWDHIIAHETFHQWFGDLVTLESWSNLPLNESFANYGEYLWNEFKYGMAEADYHLMQELETYLNEAETKQVNLIRFHYEDEMEMFDSHSYSKGGRVLHMLREYVGDDAFFQSLALYLDKNEFSAVEIHHLRSAFEEVTGEDMNWFFNQWFLASGHPILKVEKSYSNGQLTVEVWQEQDLSTTPLYRLPLYIDVYVNGEKERFPVEVNDSYEEFVFDVASKPQLVVFDGEKQLLGVIKYQKPMQELVYQYQLGEKFLSRYEAITKLSEDGSAEARATIVSALDDPFWAIRQEAIASLGDSVADKVVVKLRQMSLKDPKPAVRANAIAALAKRNPQQHLDVFKEGLKDKAYSVVGSALYAYSKTNPSDILTVMEHHESINNLNVMVPVADYYSQQGIAGKFDWFVNKINESSGGDLYYMVQYLGQYLMKMPEEVKKNGIPILEDLARNYSAFYVRLAAYQGLAMIAETEGVKQLMNDIKAKEENERLLKIYSKM